MKKHIFISLVLAVFVTGSAWAARVQLPPGMYHMKGHYTEGAELVDSVVTPDGVLHAMNSFGCTSGGSVQPYIWNPATLSYQAVNPSSQTVRFVFMDHQHGFSICLDPGQGWDWDYFM